MLKLLNSVVVEAVAYCRLLCALESSTFVEAVKSVVQAVDCCRLLCALESSCFVKTVESVVVEMLIVIGYITCSREL